MKSRPSALAVQPAGNVQFGRIPYAVIESGAIAKLRPAALKVYVVIAGHANPEWAAKVGMRRIAQKAGIELGSVSRSVKQLVEAGLVVTIRSAVVEARRRVREERDEDTRSGAVLAV